MEVEEQDEEREEKEETPESEAWIAEVLPRATALALARAAEVARGLPVGSLARAKVIRDAEKKAKGECPHAFRDDYGHCE